MTQFEVTLSSMSQASANIRTYGEEFQTTADELKAATENLTTSSEGWNSEASEIFNSNIADAHRWMTEMSKLVAEYSENLEKAREKYETTDVNAAKHFSK